MKGRVFRSYLCSCLSPSLIRSLVSLWELFLFVLSLMSLAPVSLYLSFFLCYCHFSCTILHYIFLCSCLSPSELTAPFLYLFFFLSHSEFLSLYLSLCLFLSLRLSPVIPSTVSSSLSCSCLCVFNPWYLPYPVSLQCSLLPPYTPVYLLLMLCLLPSSPLSPCPPVSVSLPYAR